MLPSLSDRAANMLVPLAFLMLTAGATADLCTSVRSSGGLEGCTSRYIEKPILSVIIQTFRDHTGRSAGQPQQLTEKLHSIPVTKEIIVNDDTQGEGSAAWLPWLRESNDFYISSPNLHEVRVYNRLAKMARGEFLVLVQGDACLPSSPSWMEDALAILRTLPNLAMLSGRVGFKEVLTRAAPGQKMNETYRNSRFFGQLPGQPITHQLRLNASSLAGGQARAQPGSLPFMFVPGVDNGPLIFRREALLALGGFDEGCAPRNACYLHTTPHAHECAAIALPRHMHISA